MKGTKPNNMGYTIGPTHCVGPNAPSANYLRGYIQARETTLACLGEDNAPRAKIRAVEQELAACKKELQRLTKRQSAPHKPSNVAIT